MPLNGHELNGAALNDGSFPGDRGNIGRRLEWVIEGDIGIIGRSLQWDITQVWNRYGEGKIGRSLEWRINPVGKIGIGLGWNVYLPVYFQACSGANAFVWRPIVNLEFKAGDRPGESGDISVTLTDTLDVEAEENAARIASFVREPRPKGPCPTETDPEFLDLTTHIGRRVTISYLLELPDGTAVSTTQLFLGYVDEVVFDPNTLKTSYTCSDGRQLRLENLDKSSIDVLMPNSFYSEFVFDAESDTLEYAEDRQSTVPYALDLDALGNWKWTPWMAKDSADFVFDDCAVLHESLGITIANYREITTEFDLEFEYGFDRMRQRLMNWGWSYPGDFCQYLDSGHTLPQKQTIVSAMNSGSWKLSNVTLENMPPSQVYNCGIDGLRNWINDGQGNAPLFALGANGTVYRKFRQGVAEMYDLRILAPQSASQFGTVKDSLSISMSSEYDSDEWQQDLPSVTEAVIERDPYQATTTISIATGTGLSLGQAEFGEFPYVDLGTGLTDRYFDANTSDLIPEGQGQRAEFETAIQTAIQVGKTSLLSAHRENSVTWETPLIPIIELDHTVEIDVCQVHARGKVSGLVHTMDIVSGRATTSITITLSKTIGAPIEETTTDVPVAPDTVSQMTEGTPFLGLDSRYGGQVAGSLFTFSYPGSTSPVINNDPFDGYTGNRSPADVGSNLYPIQFQMVTEEIEGPDRDDIEATTSKVYNVNIPNDVFELQA